jgi:hypothetical protein
MRAGDPEDDQIVLLQQLQRLHLHARRFFRGVIVRERLEVVKSDEPRRNLTHAADVEVILDPPDERLAERGAPAGHLIDVAACDGVVAGMKTMPDPLDVQNVDIRRKRVVETAAQRVWRQRRVDVEVSDLSQRVNSRIGPSLSVQFEVADVHHCPDRPLNLTLHRSGVLLNLPAAVAGPRVFDGELQPHAPLL